MALDDEWEFDVTACDVGQRDIGNPMFEGIEDLVEQSPAAQDLAGGVTQLFLLDGEGMTGEGEEFKFEASRALDPTGLLVEQVRIWQGDSAEPTSSWETVGQQRTPGDAADVSSEGPVLVIDGGNVSGEGAFVEMLGSEEAEGTIDGSFVARCP